MTKKNIKLLTIFTIIGCSLSLPLFNANAMKKQENNISSQNDIIGDYKKIEKNNSKIEQKEEEQNLNNKNSEVDNTKNNNKINEKEKNNISSQNNNIDEIIDKIEKINSKIKQKEKDQNLNNKNSKVDNTKNNNKINEKEKNNISSQNNIIDDYKKIEKINSKIEQKEKEQNLNNKNSEIDNKIEQKKRQKLNTKFENDENKLKQIYDEINHYIIGKNVPFENKKIIDFGKNFETAFGYFLEFEEIFFEIFSSIHDEIVQGFKEFEDRNIYLINEIDEEEMKYIINANKNNNFPVRNKQLDLKNLETLIYLIKKEFDELEKSKMPLKFSLNLKNYLTYIKEITNFIKCMYYKNGYSRKSFLFDINENIDEMKKIGELYKIKNLNDLINFIKYFNFKIQNKRFDKISFNLDCLNDIFTKTSNYFKEFNGKETDPTKNSTLLSEIKENISKILRNSYLSPAEKRKLKKEKELRTNTILMNDSKNRFNSAIKNFQKIKEKPSYEEYLQFKKQYTGVTMTCDDFIDCIKNIYYDYVDYENNCIKEKKINKENEKMQNYENLKKAERYKGEIEEYQDKRRSILNKINQLRDENKLTGGQAWNLYDPYTYESWYEKGIKDDIENYIKYKEAIEEKAATKKDDDKTFESLMKYMDSFDGIESFKKEVKQEIDRITNIEEIKNYLMNFYKLNGIIYNTIKEEIDKKKNFIQEDENELQGNIIIEEDENKKFINELCKDLNLNNKFNKKNISVDTKNILNNEKNIFNEKSKLLYEKFKKIDEEKK